jgi:predicted CopG family antitoxin
MHGACMATKTISIDLTAYERLTRARMSERESFSKVIKRALWPTPKSSGRAIADALDAMARAPIEVINTLDVNQNLDKPPVDRWA